MALNEHLRCMLMRKRLSDMQAVGPSKQRIRLKYMLYACMFAFGSQEQRTHAY